MNPLETLINSSTVVSPEEVQSGDWVMVVSVGNITIKRVTHVLEGDNSFDLYPFDPTQNPVRFIDDGDHREVHSGNSCSAVSI